MCVTFLHIDHDPDARYKLILVNNRDELLDRPTSQASWENAILAGRDEKDKVARGTWLAMSVDGRIANLLTIIVRTTQIDRNAPSRGVIPYRFINSNKNPIEFCESFVHSAAQYNPFQLLCFQRNEKDQYELATICNYPIGQERVLSFPPGIYGFGNSPVNEPFKKVQRGLTHMQMIVQETLDLDLCEDEVYGRLLNLATDKYQCFPDDLLKRRCGRCSELCRYRTAIFVQHPDGIRYGTRSHTMILVNRYNQVTFYEKRMATAPIKIDNAQWIEQKFQFDLI